MKKTTVETVYDDHGRVIKTVTTEETYNEPWYDPYTQPYCGYADKVSLTGAPACTARSNIPEGAITCR